MRIIKIILKILGVLTAIILLILILALDTVDNTPYFESDFYSSTRSRLDSLSKELSLAKGIVFVGSGKINITPDLGANEDKHDLVSLKEVPLAGYGSRKGAYAESIHDSLFVKAVAIQVQENIVVIIGSDILIVPPDISREVGRIIDERLGIKREQLFFTATHTHSGIGGWGEGFVGKQFAGAYNANIVDWLINQYCRAIEQAVEDLKPGKIGAGCFDAPDLIANRLIGEKGIKNSEFVFLLANQDIGKKVIIGTFDAHATTLGGWNMYFSADYPGYWQRKLEAEKVDIAVFLAGSVGSHSPRSQGERFEKSRYLGEALADSVIKYSKNVELSDSIGLSFLSLKMDLPEYHIRVSDGLRLHPVLGSRLFPEVGDVYIQSVRINDLIWVTTPCDFSGEMAIAHKNAMNKEGYKAMTTSFNGTYVGYIIPCKYYHLNAYESRLMSWFGPGMSPYTDEMIMRMMQKMISL